MTATAILYPVASKTCTKCLASLDTSFFNKSSKGALKVASVCKKCYSKDRKIKRDDAKSLDPVAYSKEACKKQKTWADKNKDKVKATFAAWKEKNRDYFANRHRNMSEDARLALNTKARDSYAVDPDKHREKSKSFREKNPEKAKESYALWRKGNMPYLRKYANDRYHGVLKVDEIFKAKAAARLLVSRSISRGGYSKKSRTTDVLGCDWEFFKSHIEKQFSKGMSWENRSEWHIDHILPMATATTEEEVIALNHFTNLRPMWAKDNLAKSDKITHLI